MSLPKNAPIFDYVADPSDEVEYYLAVTRGEDEACLLRPDEDIADWKVERGAVAVAAGLQIGTGAREPVRDGLVIMFWTTIAPASRALSIFDGDGIDLPIEATIVTTSTPARTKQVTVGQRTRQK